MIIDTVDAHSRTRAAPLILRIVRLRYSKSMINRIRTGRRLAVLATATFAFMGASMSIAAPAHANTAACIDYLSSMGYVGSDYETYCGYGELSENICRGWLDSTGIPWWIVDEACRRAAFGGRG